MKLENRIWYSYKGIPYQGTCPPYYELSGKPWFDELAKNIPLIRKKTLELLQEKGGDLKTYFNTEVVESGQWDARGFLSWGMKDKLLESEKGKEVFSFFGRIPGLVLLSVSILQPRTHVLPHNGDTDATYRLHIPVFIPAGLPVCGLRVSSMDTAWSENEIIAFSDAHVHEAWNQTDTPRIILIADVVREPVLHKIKTICVNVMALLMQQKIIGFLGLPINGVTMSKFSFIFIPPLRFAFRFWFLINGFYKHQ